MHRIRVFARILGVFALTLGGCTNSTSTSATGQVQVRMTDAPADFDAVNIVVTEVSLHRADAADSTSGWEVLSSSAQTYNLLTLQNGVFATIAHAPVPAGRYSQVRLKIGTGSSVVLGGVTFPLTVPSGSQTGIKLVGTFDVPANGTLDLALDFDAGRSIVLTGNAHYMLKPTLRVLPFSTAGAITGTILPSGTAATAFAIQGADTLSSSTCDALGHFTLSALAAGTYAVAIDAPPSFRDTTLASVAVTAGATTTLNPVSLRAP